MNVQVMYFDDYLRELESVGTFRHGKCYVLSPFVSDNEYDYNDGQFESLNEAIEYGLEKKRYRICPFGLF